MDNLGHSSERDLTANDVDNAVNRIVSTYGFLSPEMELVVEAFDDGRLEPKVAAAYLIVYETAGMAEVKMLHDLVAGNG